MVTKTVVAKTTLTQIHFFSARNKRLSINFEFWTYQFINFESSKHFTMYVTVLKIPMVSFTSGSNIYINQRYGRRDFELKCRMVSSFNKFWICEQILKKDGIMSRFIMTTVKPFTKLSLDMKLLVSKSVFTRYKSLFIQ